ncbi:hypothetical protein AVEN_21535-1 [Araneus ventricosus]|uniref:RNA-directed DNA polymerase n=1 Tax=Araneus ventricosus TaxID=182803 RepID=A0A4Y2UL55_ARAVE|nr:hypothetical protein AVEN_21535-1 [Araneus ventricosus]
MPDSEISLYCNVNSKANRFYVPGELRRKIFDNLHNMSHPGIRATKALIGSRYCWPNQNKDITNWCRACIPCQKSNTDGEYGVCLHWRYTGISSSINFEFW